MILKSTLKLKLDFKNKDKILVLHTIGVRVRVRIIFSLVFFGLEFGFVNDHLLWLWS